MKRIRRLPIAPRSPPAAAGVAYGVPAETFDWQLAAEGFTTYDQVDPLTLHGGALIRAGERWIATKWLRRHRRV